MKPTVTYAALVWDERISNKKIAVATLEKLKGLVLRETTGGEIKFCPRSSSWTSDPLRRGGPRKHTTGETMHKALSL